MKHLFKIAIMLAMMISILLSFSELAEAAKTDIASVNVSSVLNVREKASSKSKKVGSLKKGAKVTVYSKTKSGWSEIRYKKKKAYVSTKYLKFSAAKKAKTSKTLNTNTQKNSSVKFAKTSYQTTANLNLRSGSGAKDQVVLTIPKGKILTSTEKRGNTYKVSYTYKSKGKNVTKTGWVSGKYLKEYYKYTTTSKTYYVTSMAVNLRSSADTKKKVVSKLQKDNVLYSTQKVVNSLGKTWYRVSFNGKNHYVSSGVVKKVTLSNFSQTSYKAKNATVLYASYGNDYKKIMTIPKGTNISSKQRIGNWYKISYKGKSGYIHIGSFTKITKPTVEKNDPPQEKVNPPQEKITEKIVAAKTYLVKANLNVRKTANSTSSIMTKIPMGKIVIPTHKTSNNWYKVSYNGKTGYVSGTFLQEVITGDPMNGRTGYQFIDLRTQSPVTAAQINNYIANYVKVTGKTSVLSGKGQVFINSGKRYGVNALYLAAHAIHESAHGTSHLSLGKLNFFGFGAYDATPYVGAYRFSDLNASIDYIAREMKATYLNPSNWKYSGAYLGFSTKTLSNTRINANSEGMNFWYASDPNWGKKIASHMEKILPYNKSHYNKVAINTIVPAQPSVPAGSDVFPKDITAKAKKEINFHSAKGKRDAKPQKVKKGSTFTLLEKTNDFWVKVKVGNKEYWTNEIKFDVYKNYLSVENLGRVNTDGLNVRSGASTSNSIISKLNLNEYVHIVLKKDGTLTMDSSKTWYQVKLSNGKTGWVSKQYITRELN